jgi:mycothiol synthase
MLTSRSYAGPQDLAAMIDLVKARPSDRLADFPGILDLQEMLGLPEIQAGTRLWTDPRGQLAGFVILDMDRDSANLTFEIAPGCKGKGLEAEMIARAEDSVRQTHPAGTGTFLLEATTRSDDAASIDLLEELGFERQPEGAVHLERSLADPIPQPQLPVGFSIRPIHGEAEAGDWVRLHRLAHGTENMTVDYKLSMMRTPYYEPEMDLVAVVPGGGLAAYCVGFIEVEENALTGKKCGCTDPIATHPDFQRRGLSRALMLRGLALLKERGMDTAHLGTSSGNIAMIRTAESVGFHITLHVFRYGKPIPLG